MKKYLVKYYPIILIIVAILLIFIDLKFIKKEKVQEPKITEFAINELSPEKRLYNTTGDPVSLERADIKNNQTETRDFTFIYQKGVKYNPVTVSHIIFTLLDGYRKTRNQAYLDKAELYARGLKESSVAYRGALYYPYNFNFKLHGNREKMIKPWYSGMAQGQVLSVFSRLFEATGNQEYLLTAQKTAESFRQIKTSKSKIWIAMIDKNGFYWVEEYPQEFPDFTLNGYLYAVSGLYDYYLVDKTPENKKLLDAALTTSKEYLPKYRNPNGISFYCLKHKQKNLRYHQTHIRQMNYLFEITSDEFFQQLARQFYNDRK